MKYIIFVAAFPAGAYCLAEEEVEEVVIVADRPQTASSDQTVRDRDLETFISHSASDLMRLVPGLHVTQHTGGAKAHQFFLRGFDAEHGQDVATSLDGIPLNEVSHVHGQGYLDLHFLIPEAISQIRIIKGPYDGTLGNFATAGAVRFLSDPRREHSVSCQLGLGVFNTRELLAQLSGGIGNGELYAALQGEQSDGFTDPGRRESLRAFAHGRVPLGSDRLTFDLIYAGYRARSQASDTLPESWIRDGRISRFDSLDDSNRVDVDRQLAGAVLSGRSGADRFRATGYFNFKDTRIYSNFTYYYFDPTRGDQLEQSDRRNYGGLSAGYTWFSDWGGGLQMVSDAGVQYRLDDVDQTQANTERRERFNLINQYDFREHNLGAYFQEKLLLGERWMLVAALRYDLNLVDIHGQQDVKELDIYTNQVVIRQDLPREAFEAAHAVSPKLSAILSLPAGWKLFANFGRGFVTRTARDQANHAEPLAYAVTGSELGCRWTGLEGKLSVASGLWWMHKDRELVFDSEFGGTVPRGQSHRLGAELELRYAPRPWIWLATDLFFIHTRLDTGSQWSPIPNAPSWLMTNVLALDHPGGWVAALRGRLVGERRHDLGLHSPGYYLVDLLLAYETRHTVIALELDNLLDAEWYDSVFAYPVRPAPGEPVDWGLQVTPGTPFAARIKLTVRI